MALVQMADRRLLAERAEGADAADAQDDLLLDPVLLVTAVELGGDVAILRAVLGDVAVEQVQGHAADLDPPHLDLHLTARQRDRDDYGPAASVMFEDERQ